ncbi:MAG: hypothetical protein ACW98K_00540 [Candidatus Kariarchaeaceae archaeon]
MKGQEEMKLIKISFYCSWFAVLFLFLRALLYYDIWTNNNSYLYRLIISSDSVRWLNLINIGTATIPSFPFFIAGFQLILLKNLISQLKQSERFADSSLFPGSERIPDEVTYTVLSTKPKTLTILGIIWFLSFIILGLQALVIYNSIGHEISLNTLFFIAIMGLLTFVLVIFELVVTNLLPKYGIFRKIWLYNSIRLLLGLVMFFVFVFWFTVPDRIDSIDDLKYYAFMNSLISLLGYIPSVIVLYFLKTTEDHFIQAKSW